MQIHNMFKTFIAENKKKIELTQWAVMNSIASLVYAEYLQRFKQKQYPVKRIMIPPIKYVNQFLKHDGQFMTLLSNNLVDDIVKHPLFDKYKDAPELVIFNDQNVELLKTVVDLYIIPNIEKRIPETLSMKFAIGDDSQQLFIEDNTIDLFERKPIDSNQFSFIVEETILQMLFLLPTMKKSIEIPENNKNIHMTANEILTINNSNALCPLHINLPIINNKNVIDLFSFVTSTTFKNICDGEIAAQKNNEIVLYSIDTNPFNEAVLIKFEGIENIEE